MCRNIRPLFNFEPPAYPDELHEAALQYVRKVTGITTAAGMQRPEFQQAVAAVAAATATVIEALPARRVPPRTEPPLRRLALADGS